MVFWGVKKRCNGKNELCRYERDNGWWENIVGNKYRRRRYN